MKRSEEALLSVSNLSIGFSIGGSSIKALDGVTFDVNPGETLGIVGESGSGKSLTSLAIMGLLPPTAIVQSGEITFNAKSGKHNLLSISPSDFRKVRGNKIGMIFQEPMTSLNPVHTCGNQVAEVLILHKKLQKSEARKEVERLFDEVELPEPKRIFDSYPHQLSGGQKQRVMIAMAMCCEPELVIADEPTTALDVTVQGKILELLKNLCDRNGTGLIFITHDLGVVSQIADRVMVMFRGQVLEKGDAESVLKNPKTDYTKALIACKPPLDSKPYRLKVVEDYESNSSENRSEVQKKKQKTGGPLYGNTLLEIRDLNVWFPSKKSLFGKPLEYVKAVNGVSFEIKKGETLGLVGESGCGKSTLGRAILRLTPAYSGEVVYKGKNILDESMRQFTPKRRHMQLVFQDPYASLNPRFTVQETLIEPMIVHDVGHSKGERLKKIHEILDRVGLPASSTSKYPHEFSGGQRQRVCIARALVTEPEFIICDESVSALDVSVQAQVLNLLNDLKDELDLTYVFVSHDLSVVKYMSDKLMVMRKGRIEEIGNSEEIYLNPKSDYTKSLIAAIPQFSY